MRGPWSHEELGRLKRVTRERLESTETEYANVRRGGIEDGRRDDQNAGGLPDDDTDR
jgi:hypothetical protein